MGQGSYTSLTDAARGGKIHATMLFPGWPDYAALAASPLWPWAAWLLGLIVGSFANVCIHRLPRRESIVTPASRCPSCGTLIRPWQNVPIVSYALLRGRCGSCGARISLRYPAVEAANGLLYLLVALVAPPTLRALALMVFVSALLVLSLIDLEHHLLPDVITLPGIVCGVIASFLPDAPVRPIESVASAIGGYAAFFLVAETYRRTRGIEGLGQGDWKMAAMLGAFLGWQSLLLTVFVATLAGSVVGVTLMTVKGRDARDALPLGTFLGLAGIAVTFCGQSVVTWYRGLLVG
jgi:leader peptidase (prepilin peptidase)/N-methyltransferase